MYLPMKLFSLNYFAWLKLFLKYMQETSIHKKIYIQHMA